MATPVQGGRSPLPSPLSIPRSTKQATPTSRRLVQAALVLANLIALRGVYTDIITRDDDAYYGRRLQRQPAGQQQPILPAYVTTMEKQAMKRRRMRQKERPQGTMEDGDTADGRKRRKFRTRDERDPAFAHPTRVGREIGGRGARYRDFHNPKNVDISNPPDFAHYFIHIPKTGGVYARDLFNEDARALTLAGTLPRRTIVCDQGVKPVEQWKTWNRTFSKISSRGRRKVWQCGMYMTESHYSRVPDHTYTVIRDPREHVLSQYFHCTESRHHVKKAGFMPKRMDEWLDAWVEIMDADDALRERGTGGGGVLVGHPRSNERATMINVTDHETLQRLGKRFKCYNPIDMQSTLLGFARRDLNKEDLARRYDVLGVTANLDRSVCLVSIRWSGAVPERCDCTDVGAAAAEGRRRKESVVDGGGGGGGRGGKAAGGGGGGGTSDFHSHSVVHHGATYEATERQLEAIDRLTRRDRRLYELATEMFEEEVRKVEEEYSIKLC